MGSESLKCLVSNCDGDIARLKKLCLICYDHWHRHQQKGWDAWMVQRTKWLDKVKPFQLCPLPKIDADKRVITKKGGIRVNGTHICSTCNKDKFISNATYHLCATCANHWQYYGESCGVCNIKSEGTAPVYWNPTLNILNCANCKGKIRKYGLSVEKLKEYLAVVNCPLCDVVLTNDRSHTGRSIDHDHDCCSHMVAHKGFQKTCGRCVRGVICGRCNIVEGQLPENPELWLDKVIAWRKGYKAKPHTTK